jgi:Ca-activated chloride channel family protein
MARGLIPCSGVSSIPAVVLALLMAGLWSGGDPGSGQATQARAAKATFRAGVDLVRVSAVVRDNRGRPVLGLSRADFQVAVSGTRVPIVEFESEATGVSLAVLVDSSGSMKLAGKMEAAREVVSHMIRWVEPARDEVTLLSFDRNLRTVHPFTTQPLEVLPHLGELKPYGMTSLYDAIAQAARPLVSRDRPRRAVLVVTDGIDNGSELTPPEVSRIASEIDVPVYVVAIRVGADRIGGIPGADTVIDPASQATLEDLAAWTGGEAFTAGTPAETSLVARQILTELRHQYLIAFEANSRAGWHPLSIGMRKKNLYVRARGGYMTGTSSGSL